MHYEECMIDGIMHYKTSPDGKWESFSLEELSSLYTQSKCYNITLMKEITNIYADLCKQPKL